MAVNSSVSESTGYSPSLLTQVRVARLPNALYDRETLGTGRQKVNLEKAAPDQATQRIGISENQMSKAAAGLAAKLAPRYEGPYQAVDFVSHVIATKDVKRNISCFKQQEQADEAQITEQNGALPSETKLCPAECRFGSRS